MAFSSCTQTVRPAPYSIPPPRLSYGTTYPSTFAFPPPGAASGPTSYPSSFTFPPPPGSGNAVAAPSTGNVSSSTSANYFRTGGAIFSSSSFPPQPTVAGPPLPVNPNPFPTSNYAYPPPHQLNSHLQSPMSSMAPLAHVPLTLPQEDHTACSSTPSSPDLAEDRLSHKDYSPQTPNEMPLHSPDGMHMTPFSTTYSSPQTMFPGPVYTPPEYPSSSVMPSNAPCLPQLPICNWNSMAYPPLSTTCTIGASPASIPKLSYDSPRFKLTPERAIPLIKWFEEHKDHPYPTRHEKMLLCQSTQLTFTQVSTWFANARRRMKKANAEEERSNSSDDNSCNGDSPLSSESTAAPPKTIETEH